MGASWIELAGAALGGGAVGELIKLFAFRDHDAAAVRRELLARIERLEAEVKALRVLKHYWLNVAQAMHLRMSELMAEVNELLEAAGMPEKYTREAMFTPLPDPPGKDE